MADKEIQSTLSQLQSLSASNLSNATSLLTQAKLQLLQLNALIPTPNTPPAHLALGRQVLETGALISARQRDTVSIARYYQQLQPFYALAEQSDAQAQTQQSKITGVYLLSLLSQGEYAGFHTVIESLEVAHGGRRQLDQDALIQYPLRLMQALMEGSYDKVWGETKGQGVPCEEYGVFSEVSAFSDPAVRVHSARQG